MRVVLNDIEYELIKNNKDSYSNEEIKDLCTEYFSDFDYILGDYSYEKLRLKGFYDDNNKKSKDFNKYSYLEEYIKNYCAYDCKYFILKKKQ